jgi:hypothetical protein
MVQGREDLRFALEAGQSIGVVRERRGKDLQRDVAREPRVARSPDLAHSARSEGGLDFVRAQACAGGKGH